MNACLTEIVDLGHPTVRSNPGAKRGLKLQMWIGVRITSIFFAGSPVKDKTRLVQSLWQLNRILHPFSPRRRTLRMKVQMYLPIQTNIENC